MPFARDDYTPAVARVRVVHAIQLGMKVNLLCDTSADCRITQAAIDKLHAPEWVTCSLAPAKKRSS